MASMMSNLEYKNIIEFIQKEESIKELNKFIKLLEIIQYRFEEIDNIVLKRMSEIQATKN